MDVCRLVRHFMSICSACLPKVPWQLRIFFKNYVSEGLNKTFQDWATLILLFEAASAVKFSKKNQTDQGTSLPMSEQTKQSLKNPAGYTDDQIIRSLLGSELQREQVFAYLYRTSGWREWVIRHVAAEGGDEPAGEDVFQETLILFDRNIREGRFSNESALKTYFLGIAKQYWFNRRRNIRPVPLSPDYDQPVSENPERIALQEERRNIIDLVLEHLGEHCKKVLQLYKLSLSNEEIAQELELSSPEMAKKYTYRCREKFKSFVSGRKDILEHLDIRLNNE